MTYYDHGDLNSAPSPSTGSYTAFYGPVQWGENSEESRAIFFEVADCQRKVRLHKAGHDTMPDFIQKMRQLAAGANHFADWLEKERWKKIMNNEAKEDDRKECEFGQRLLRIADEALGVWPEKDSDGYPTAVVKGIVSANAAVHDAYLNDKRISLVDVEHVVATACCARFESRWTNMDLSDYHHHSLEGEGYLLFAKAMAMLIQMSKLESLGECLRSQFYVSGAGENLKNILGDIVDCE